MAKVVSLSEAAQIALHAMVLISRSDKQLNVLQISELTESSKHHVAKIMQRLVKENFLSSVRGPSGGFTMKKDPSTINLLDIYEAVEGKLEISSCPMNRKVCAFEKCIYDNITNRMTIQFRDFLKENSLDKFSGF